MYESNNALQPLLWGLSEQSWQFTDERDTCMLAGIPRWEQLLSAAGFQKVRRRFQKGSTSKAGTCIRSKAFCLHVLEAGAAAQLTGVCLSMHRYLLADHGAEGGWGRQRSDGVPQEAGCRACGPPALPGAPCAHHQ